MGSVFARQSKISQIPSKYLGICYRNLLLLVKVSLVGPQPPSREQITLSSSRAKFREGNDLIWSALLLHSFCPSLDGTDYARIAPLIFHSGGPSLVTSIDTPTAYFRRIILPRSLARAVQCGGVFLLEYLRLLTHSDCPGNSASLGCLTCDVFATEECDDQVA